jgi:hypothetical protein
MSEPLAGNFGNGRDLDHKISVIEPCDLHSRGNRVRLREELLPYVTGPHELLDIRGVVRERHDVSHRAAKTFNNGPYVLERLSHLRSHIARSNDLAVPVERNLAL